MWAAGHHDTQHGAAAGPNSCCALLPASLSSRAASRAKVGLRRLSGTSLAQLLKFAQELAPCLGLRFPGLPQPPRLSLLPAQRDHDPEDNQNDQDQAYEDPQRSAGDGVRRHGTLRLSCLNCKRTASQARSLASLVGSTSSAGQPGLRPMSRPSQMEPVNRAARRRYQVI
ncbi:MAG: hypothetical protein DLM66_06470 [Candidatus Dormiibacter spiritus]|nr:MAG: hypothetical protein DLM66_06470 [Candidatus Dormibacteraeota bacterium]